MVMGCLGPWLICRLQCRGCCCLQDSFVRFRRSSASHLLLLLPLLPLLPPPQLFPVKLLSSFPLVVPPLCRLVSKESIQDGRMAHHDRRTLDQSALLVDQLSRFGL